MTEEFVIEGIKLEAELNPTTVAKGPFEVQSVPRPYRIEWLGNDATPASLVNKDKSAIVLIDKRIRKLWFEDLDTKTPRFEIEAKETNKTINSAIRFAEYLESIGTTKSNMIYVIGGGIMQDIGAFACAMYKRGIPWTYFPTTLLGMADSCIGGKTGLNHNITKNLLALFSAPHRIIHFLPFLDTLPAREVIAGYGEALRLHATGGPRFFDQFEANIDNALDGSSEALQTIISGALSVKRAVVEEDEFETSLRRSMNYGHSIGHAIEALTNFAFPHGMGISIGVMVENMIASARYGLNVNQAERINMQAAKLVDGDARSALANMDFGEINLVLKKDKKTIGNILKLAVPISLGEIQFHNFQLDDTSQLTIKHAFEEAGLL